MYNGFIYVELIEVSCVLFIQFLIDQDVLKVATLMITTRFMEQMMKEHSLCGSKSVNIYSSTQCKDMRGSIS